MKSNCFDIGDNVFFVSPSGFKERGSVVSVMRFYGIPCLYDILLDSGYTVTCRPTRLEVCE